jgi:hypothetical protein
MLGSAPIYRSGEARMITLTDTGTGQQFDADRGVPLQPLA